MLTSPYHVLILFSISELINLDKLASQANEECTPSSPLCVCSYPFLIEDLKALIQSSSPHDLLEKLTYYQCPIYRFLPIDLSTDPQRFDLHPDPQSQFSHQLGQGQPPFAHRLPKTHTNLNRRKRQIAEPFQDFATKLRHVLPKLSKSGNNHVYAFLGHQIRLQCQGSKSSQGFNGKFEWFHSTGDPVSGPAVTIDQRSGDLNIFSVQLSDIDIYNCTESDLKSKSVNSYSHQLSVVTDSINWLSVTSYFETPACSIGQINFIEVNLNQWISTYVCPICTIHDPSIVCDTIATQDDPEVNEYQVQFALTVFNLDTKIDLKLSPGQCPESCLKALHLLLLRIVQESLGKLLNLPLHLGDGGVRMLYSKENWQSFQLMTGCLAGFQLMYKLCFPCLSGQFSLRGDSECQKCPKGTYQPSLGASRCLPCHDGYDTLEEGSAGHWSCLPEAVARTYDAAKTNKTLAILLSIFFAILILIVLIFCIICCCFPKTKLGKYLRQCFASFCLCFVCCSCAKKSLSKNILANEENLQKKLSMQRKVSDLKNLQETERNELSEMVAQSQAKRKVKRSKSGSGKKYSVKYNPLTTTEVTTSDEIDTDTDQGEEVEPRETNLRPILIGKKFAKNWRPTGLHTINTDQANQTDVDLDDPENNTKWKTVISKNKKIPYGESADLYEMYRRQKNENDPQFCPGCNRKLDNVEESQVGGHRSTEFVRVKEKVAKTNASLGQNKNEDLITQRHTSRASSGVKEKSRDKNPRIDLEGRPIGKYWQIERDKIEKKKKLRNEVTTSDDESKKMGSPSPLWQNYCPQCVRPFTKQPPKYKPPPPPAPPK